MTMKLVLIATGNAKPLVFDLPNVPSETITRLGSAAHCELRIPGELSRLVGRTHCMFENRDGMVTIIDAQSGNVMLRNEETIPGPTPLQIGDRIQIGPTLVFEVRD